MHTHENGEDKEELCEDDFIRPIQNRLDQTHLKLFCDILVLHHYRLDLDERQFIRFSVSIANPCENFSANFPQIALKQHVSSANTCQLDVIVPRV